MQKKDLNKAMTLTELRTPENLLKVKLFGRMKKATIVSYHIKKI